MKKIKIAITGGIASGKSSVANIIKNLGYSVFSADKIYNDLIKNEEIVKKISEKLGVLPKIIDGKFQLDKEAVSNLVFNNKEKLKTLNSFTHALVYEKIQQIFENLSEELVFFEVPLLFESNMQDNFDQVFVVVRDKKQRILSAMERDNVSKDKILQKIANQVDYDNLALNEHTIIYNDGDLTALNSKVVLIIEDIKKKFI